MKHLFIAMVLLASTYSVVAEQSPIPQKVSYISPVDSRIFLSMSTDNNAQWVDLHNTVPNQPMTNYVFLKGAKNIDLWISVPKDSINYYRYKIFTNDENHIISGSVVGRTTSEVDLNSTLPAAPKLLLNYVKIHLGSFNVEQRVLTVECSKITETNKTIKTIIYDKEIKSAKFAAVAISGITKNGQSFIKNIPLSPSFDIEANDSARINNMIISIKAIDVSFIYHVCLKNKSTQKIIASTNEWNYNPINGNPYLIIDASLFKTPGKYEITVVPELSHRASSKILPFLSNSHFEFNIIKSERLYSFKDILLWTIIVVIMGSLFTGTVIYFIKKSNKKKLDTVQQNNKFTQLQLSLVRMQLNPHFMFNALSGIQNLMNKNEVDQANRYLSKFARLTRSILYNGDLTTIGEEAAFLEDYLRMEQLRFGFSYKIITEVPADSLNVEIPTMIIQPIVENAVKHGVSPLKQDGMIEVGFTQKNADLIIFIKDNGKGFILNKKGGGLGLQLIQNRIQLLNETYKYSRINLGIKSEFNITTATIILNDWL